MADFICTGVATLDRVWRLDRLPAGGGKYPSRGYMEVGGGLAANAAVTIARLGGSVDLWTRVGSDAAADTIVNGLVAEQVGCGNVRRVPGARSTTAAVLVDAAGERIITADHDPALSTDASHLPLDGVARARGVMADVRWVDGAATALSAARDARIPSVLDCEPSAAPVFERLCPLASHVIFSTPGLVSYAATTDLETGLAKAHAAFDGTVAVTLGERGVLLRTRDGVTHVPAPRVEVVDTTGAGDAFHGAYLLSICEHGDCVRAARFANAVAALKCTRMGGRAGLPTRAEADAFMKEHSP
jgi:sulfofructose kinase